MPDRTCGSCRYWVLTAGVRCCRRYPPVTTEKIGYTQEWDVPPTGESWWCGEWKPKTRSHDSKDWPHPSVRGQG